MNNRQKAKHFKLLYERTLPTKPSSIKIVREDLDHFRVQVLLSPEQIALRPTEMVKKIVVNRLAEDMKEAIAERMVWEQIIEENKIKYSVDVWFRKYIAEKR